MEADNTLEVMRDGNVDNEYYRQITRQAHIAALQAGFKNLGHNVLDGLQTAATELITPVVLDIHDYRYGSHLRKDYFKQRREAETQAMRERLGL